MKADKKDKGKKVANAETTDQAEQAAHTSKRNPEGIKKKRTKSQAPAQVKDMSAGSTEMPCEPTTCKAAPSKRLRCKSKPVDADSKEADAPSDGKHESKKAKKGKRAKHAKKASAGESKNQTRKSNAKKSASKKDQGELGNKANSETTPNGPEHTPEDQDLGELGAEELGYLHREKGYRVGSLLLGQTLMIYFFNILNIITTLKGVQETTVCSQRIHPANQRHGGGHEPPV